MEEFVQQVVTGISIGSIYAIIALAIVRTRLDKKPGPQRFFKTLGVIEIAFISVLLGALVFFGCLQIILRNFYNRGIIWADPLMRHIVLWLGRLGAAPAC